MKPLILAVVLFATGCATPQAWRTQFDNRLPLLGHRNFVVVADSAYPDQSNPGITTLYTDEDHLAVIAHVLAEVGSAQHVNPVVYVDSELASVPEDDAPGIGAFRAGLAEVLGDRAVKTRDHMETIHELDTSAQLFNVLVLKTRGILPYSSVFIELDCGYWDDEAEQRMRRRH